MINDDYANRMVAIDPTTGALVWQYGITDAAGTGVGHVEHARRLRRHRCGWEHPDAPFFGLTSGARRSG